MKNLEFRYVYRRNKPPKFYRNGRRHYPWASQSRADALSCEISETVKEAIGMLDKMMGIA